MAYLEYYIHSKSFEVLLQHPSPNRKGEPAILVHKNCGYHARKCLYAQLLNAIGR